MRRAQWPKRRTDQISSLRGGVPRPKAVFQRQDQYGPRRRKRVVMARRSSSREPRKMVERVRTGWLG